MRKAREQKQRIEAIKLMAEKIDATGMMDAYGLCLQADSPECGKYFKRFLWQKTLPQHSPEWLINTF